MKSVSVLLGLLLMMLGSTLMYIYVLTGKRLALSVTGHTGPLGSMHQWFSTCLSFSCIYTYSTCFCCRHCKLFKECANVEMCINTCVRMAVWFYFHQRYADVQVTRFYYHNKRPGPWWDQTQDYSLLLPYLWPGRKIFSRAKDRVYLVKVLSSLLYGRGTLLISVANEKMLEVFENELCIRGTVIAELWHCIRLLTGVPCPKTPRRYADQRPSLAHNIGKVT